MTNIQNIKYTYSFTCIIIKMYFMSIGKREDD